MKKGLCCRVYSFFKKFFIGVGDTYIDERGYFRYINTNRLVHRDIAYKEIYLPEWKRYGKQCEYPSRFREYEIHHKDRNKLNNNVDNLQILMHEEHSKEHGIKIDEMKVAEIKVTKIMKLYEEHEFIQKMRESYTHNGFYNRLNKK